jgi:uncharacterized protein YecA (UPF0149 family)
MKKMRRVMRVDVETLDHNTHEFKMLARNVPLKLGTMTPANNTNLNEAFYDQYPKLVKRITYVNCDGHKYIQAIIIHVIE